MSASTLFARHRFAAGEHIVAAGDPAEACFIVQSGRVELLARNEAGLYETVATLGPGQVFGEHGLTGARTHDKGARAAAASECIAVSRAALDRRLETADPFVAALVKVLAGNLTAILDRKTAADRDRGGTERETGSLDDLARFAD